jgi:hypothetical protein
MPLNAKTKIIGKQPAEEVKQAEIAPARPSGSKTVTKKFSLESFKKAQKQPPKPVEEKNAVFSIEDVRRKQTQVQPKPVEEIKGPEKPRKVKINRFEDAEEIQDATLVVNGQKRKLSKNSAYMLDMVSLDDE